MVTGSSVIWLRLLGDECQTLLCPGGVHFSKQLSTLGSLLDKRSTSPWGRLYSEYIMLDASSFAAPGGRQGLDLTGRYFDFHLIILILVLTLPLPVPYISVSSVCINLSFFWGWRGAGLLEDTSTWNHFKSSLSPLVLSFQPAPSSLVLPGSLHLQSPEIFLATCSVVYPTSWLDSAILSLLYPSPLAHQFSDILFSPVCVAIAFSPILPVLDRSYSCHPFTTFAFILISLQGWVRTMPVLHLHHLNKPISHWLITQTCRLKLMQSFLFLVSFPSILPSYLLRLSLLD